MSTITVTPGYVMYTIMNADGTVSSQTAVLVKQQQAAIIVANGTGYIYTVGDKPMGYEPSGTAIPADEMTDDVVVYRGYVKVTYQNGENYTVNGPEFVKATGDDAGKVEVTFTVSGKASDVITVAFSGTNVDAGQQKTINIDEGATSATGTIILDLTSPTADTVVSATATVQ